MFACWRGQMVKLALQAACISMCRRETEEQGVVQVSFL